MTSDQISCTVRGTLAVVLRLSKLHGVAPLHMKSKSDGDAYTVRVAKPGFLTWFLLVMIICTILIGLIMDLNLYGTHTAIRVKTTSALVVWFGDLTTLMTITFVGVCQGEKRMKRTLKLLKDIEKIQKDIGGDYKHSKERAFTVSVIILIIYVYVIVALDFSVYVLDAYVYERERVIAYIYGLVYFGYILTLLLIMQVIFVVMAIHATFKTINTCLQNIIDLNKVKYNQPLKNNSSIITNIIKPVNIADGWISKLDEISGLDQIQNLADSYILLCRVVETFNEENGLLILLLIGSYIGYTFISNYYIIRDLCSPDLVNQWKNVSSILIPLVWTVFRFIEFFSMIESFHRTHEQMDETQVLLSKVVYYSAPVGYMISPELQTFYKQIVLYKPSFSPLYILTMHRSQIAAIIAGVTTYMVVIIQYHLIEECKET